MGLDQQVNSIVDQYRSNPQGLQQKYSQNKQLVDLLALQKLKSDKEQAAREMQMQMDPSQATIAQQREQQVMGLTRNEVAQQIGSTMQQQEQERQKRMQAMTGMPKQGIAAAMPPRPQPPQRMAAGGIVGLSGGGGTTEERMKAAYDKAIAEGKTPEEAQEIAKLAVSPYKDSAVTKGIESLKDRISTEATSRTALEQADKIRKAEAEGGPLARSAEGIRSIIPMGGAVLEDIANSDLPNIADLAGAAYNNPIAKTARQGLSQLILGRPNAFELPTGAPEAQSQDAPPNTPPTPTAKPGMGPPMMLKSSANNPEDVGIATVGSEAPAATGTSASAASAASSNPYDALARQGIERLLQEDPAAREAAMRGQYEADMADYKKGIAGMEAERERYDAEYKRQTDPRKEARQQLWATLGGIGRTGGTTFARAAAGAQPAYQRELERQEKNRLEGIAALEAMRDRTTDKKGEYGKGIFGAGERGYNTGMDAVQAGTTSATSRANTVDMTGAQREATQARMQSDKLYQLINASSMQQQRKTDLILAVQDAQQMLNMEQEYRKAMQTIAEAQGGGWFGPSQREVEQAMTVKRKMEQDAFGAIEREIAQMDKRQMALDERLGIDTQMPSPTSGANVVDFTELRP